MEDGSGLQQKKEDCIMEFKFEKLLIWQKAMDFGESINKIAHTFPQDEIYNLSSQMRRAVDSIALNIAEGSIGQKAEKACM